MDRSFQEVFPGLKGDREVQGLLPLMDVRSIRYSRDKKSLLIFTRVKRLVPRTLLARIEPLLDEQFLSDYQGSLRAKICEEYLLPDTYRLPDVMQEYRESLIAECVSESPVATRLLRLFVSGEIVPTRFQRRLRRRKVATRGGQLAGCAIFAHRSYP